MTALKTFEAKATSSLDFSLWAMLTSRDRDALNSLTREGLAYLGSADGPALTHFIHEFFCGDDPAYAYDSPGKLSTFSIDHTLPSD